jgi:hypothetical protein
MAWQKGKRKKLETKSDVLPPVKVNQSPGKKEKKDEGWEPKPDMGKIAPPSPAQKSGKCCDHEKGMHYGGSKGWCNAGGCVCQESLIYPKRK